MDEWIVDRKHFFIGFRYTNRQPLGMDGWMVCGQEAIFHWVLVLKLNTVDIG
jgi:hypothetical protein